MSRLEAEYTRKKYIEENHFKKVRRLPYGLRKGASRARAEQRIAEQIRQRDSYKFELNPQAKDHLVEIRDQAHKDLISLKQGRRERRRHDWWLQRSASEHPNYLSQFAELSLRRTWSSSKLEGVRDDVLTRRVDALVDELYGQGNDYLMQSVGLDEKNRAIPRYVDTLRSLEASLPRPKINGSRP